MAFVLCALLVTAPASHAAKITSVDIGDSGKLIFIDGKIESGDLDRFLSAAGATDNAAVLLRSSGGDLREGLRIAKAIRLGGFNTGVAPDFICASACALIWLSGTTRYMAPTSLIGVSATPTPSCHF
jgi:ATP-dependent protease ClpP protease subunit